MKRFRELLATPYTWVALLGALFAAILFRYVFAFFAFAFITLPIPVLTQLAWLLSQLPVKVLGLDVPASDSVGYSVSVAAKFWAVFVFALAFIALLQADRQRKEETVDPSPPGSGMCLNPPDAESDARIGESGSEPQLQIGARARMHWTSRCVLVAALLLYGASLFFLPLYECDSGRPFFRFARDGEAAAGFFLLLFGWIGIFGGEPRWLANPLFLSMVYELRKASTKTMAYTWPVLACVAAISTIFVPTRGCGHGWTKSLAIGGYAWVIAIVSVSLLYILRLRMASSRTDRAQ